MSKKVLAEGLAEIRPLSGFATVMAGRLVASRAYRVPLQRALRSLFTPSSAVRSCPENIDFPFRSGAKSTLQLDFSDKVIASYSTSSEGNDQGINYESKIEEYYQEKKLKDIDATYSQMKAAKVRPSAKTYGTILQTYLQLGEMDKVSLIYQEMSGALFSEKDKPGKVEETYALNRSETSAGEQIQGRAPFSKASISNEDSQAVSKNEEVNIHSSTISMATHSSSFSTGIGMQTSSSSFSRETTSNFAVGIGRGKKPENLTQTGIGRGKKPENFMQLGIGRGKVDSFSGAGIGRGEKVEKAKPGKVEETYALNRLEISAAEQVADVAAVSKDEELKVHSSTIGMAAHSSSHTDTVMQASSSYFSEQAVPFAATGMGMGKKPENLTQTGIGRGKMPENLMQTGIGRGKLDSFSVAGMGRGEKAERLHDFDFHGSQKSGTQGIDTQNLMESGIDTGKVDRSSVTAMGKDEKMERLFDFGFSGSQKFSSQGSEAQNLTERGMYRGKLDSFSTTGMGRGKNVERLFDFDFSGSQNFGNQGTDSQNLAGTGIGREKVDSYTSTGMGRGKKVERIFGFDFSGSQQSGSQGTDVQAQVHRLQMEKESKKEVKDEYSETFIPVIEPGWYAFAPEGLSVGPGAGRGRPQSPRAQSSKLGTSPSHDTESSYYERSAKIAAHKAVPAYAFDSKSVPAEPEYAVPEEQDKSSVWDQEAAERALNILNAQILKRVDRYRSSEEVSVRQRKSLQIAQSLRQRRQPSDVTPIDTKVELTEEEQKKEAERLKLIEQNKTLQELEQTFDQFMRCYGEMALEPEHELGDFTNPDIDEKPFMPLDEYLEKAKPNIMKTGLIRSEKEWQDMVKETMRHLPYYEEFVERYAGPGRYTAKQENEDLEEIAATLPSDTGRAAKSFVQRSLTTLKSNPAFNLQQKQWMIASMVDEFSQYIVND